MDLAYAEAKSRVTGGLASSRIFELTAANMVARRYAPGFRVDLRHKDLEIVTAAAREAGVAIPLGTVAWTSGTTPIRRSGARFPRAMEERND